MASRIAVMSAGRFLQVGAPAEIYETPTSRFVADFIGNVNLMDGTVSEDEADHVVVDCGDCRHWIGHGITGTPGMKVSVALRPEKIRLDRTPPEDDALQGAGHVQPRPRQGQGARLLRQLHRLPPAARRRADPQDQPEQRRAANHGRADLGRRGLGQLGRALAGGADAMRPLAPHGLAARPQRGDRRSLCLAAGVLPAAVLRGREDQRFRDGDDDDQRHRHLERRRDRLQPAASATTWRCCTTISTSRPTSRA